MHWPSAAPAPSERLQAAPAAGSGSLPAVLAAVRSWRFEFPVQPGGNSPAQLTQLRPFYNVMKPAYREDGIA